MKKLIQKTQNNPEAILLIGILNEYNLDIKKDIILILSYTFIRIRNFSKFLKNINKNKNFKKLIKTKKS